MIITIARQCGSGGHKVAQILADKLGLELFDKKRLLEEARKLDKEDEFNDFFNGKTGKQSFVWNSNEFWK